MSSDKTSFPSFKKRIVKKSKKNVRKSANTEAKSKTNTDLKSPLKSNNSESDDDDESDDSLSDEDQQIIDSKLKLKKRKRESSKKNLTLNQSSEGNIVDSSELKNKNVGIVEYEASHEATVIDTNEATKQNILYVDDDDSKKAETGKNQNDLDKSVTDDEIYKGDKNYKTFIKTRESLVKKGPLKAPSFIKSTTMMDYQPDVCKDYKQTGYCGYGDSCKFLHAREDYLAGWQLDREWEQKNLNKKNQDDSKEVKEKKEKVEEIPFKCVICKGNYKSPMKTNCGHYFCESCFLKRYRVDPTCFICGINTNGIIHPAKKLKEMLRQRV